MREEGIKFDQDKVDLAFMLEFPDLFENFCLALEEGERKYGRRNYLMLEPRRVVAALMRHVQAHANGQIWDRETGISHLGYAVANLAMLSVMKGEPND